MFNIKNTLIAIGAFLLTLIGVFLKGKKAGKEQELHKQNKRILDDIKKSAEIINNVTDDNYNELCDKYSNK